MAKIGRNEPCPCGSGKKYKKCCAQASEVSSQQTPAPKCFRSERYIVSVGIGGNRHKVLQIMFGKKDGSLYVNFPYYQHSQGLVSQVTFPGKIKLPTSLSLEPGGKVTSHLVKYSHHPDGRAHFSQDGRVLTVVRKQSIPLANLEGHVFTVQIQGMSDYELADKVTDTGTTLKKTTLTFDFAETEPQAIKIVGRWYSKESLLSRLKGKVEGPIVPCETSEGKKYYGFLLANPHEPQTGRHNLLLTCEGVPLLDKDNMSTLTFIGGFDSPAIVKNRNIDTTFLALSYPI